MIRIEDFVDPSKPTQDDEPAPIVVKRQQYDTVPWVNKYRPRKLKDIAHQTEVIKILEKTVETGNLPHILFYGPPGTGKTSTALAITRELFGPKVMRKRIIELNASDEHGINVVRDKIIKFARSAIGTPDPDYPCPPFKIIILDEADAMTNDAQSALRKTIEETSRITRFMFICNYINRIIDPIISRCTKFRFQPLPEKSMLGRLQMISHREDMVLSTAVYKSIVDVSGGDMRKAIMLLQNIKYTYKHYPIISTKHVYEIANWIPPEYLSNLLNKCFSTDDSISTKWSLKTTRELTRYGYSAQQFLEQLVDWVTVEDRFSDHQKSLIALRMATSEKKLNDGASEYLQILSILTWIHGVAVGRFTDLQLSVS